jgi:hypothetical protein
LYPRWGDDGVRRGSDAYAQLDAYRPVVAAQLDETLEDELLTKPENAGEEPTGRRDIRGVNKTAEATTLTSPPR